MLAYAQRSSMGKQYLVVRTHDEHENGKNLIAEAYCGHHTNITIFYDLEHSSSFTFPSHISIDINSVHNTHTSTWAILAHLLSYISSSSSSPSSPSGGKSPTSHRSGLTKTPQFLPHWKYLFPLIEPSFLPVGSSRAMPIQLPMPPGISGTGPM